MSSSTIESELLRRAEAAVRRVGTAAPCRTRGSSPRASRVGLKPDPHRARTTLALECEFTTPCRTGFSPSSSAARVPFPIAPNNCFAGTTGRAELRSSAERGSTLHEHFEIVRTTHVCVGTAAPCRTPWIVAENEPCRAEARPTSGTKNVRRSNVNSAPIWIQYPCGTRFSPSSSSSRAARPYTTASSSSSSPSATGVMAISV